MSGVVHMEVGTDEEGMRLDRWFRNHFPGLRHIQLQKLLRTGQVRIDGGRVKANLRLQAGMSIRVPPGVGFEPDKSEAQRSGVEWQTDLTITHDDRDFVQGLVIYKDADVIAVNKPSGLPVQGGTRSNRHLDGLLDGLKFRCPERPRLVHRLDKDTSGVLLLARSRRVAQILGHSLKYREAKKLYWALVIGAPRPESGKIDLALLKRGRPGQERVRGSERDEEDALRAVTYYRVIENAGQGLTWLGLMPITGRTHQLRVHCAAIKHPIVGDGKYAGSAAQPGGDLPRRLHLHARAIRIPHPSGGWLELVAPLPEHMLASWTLLGFDSNAPTNFEDWEV